MTRWGWRRVLAGGAAIAGVLAPFAGSPDRRSATRGELVDSLARAVADQEDHVPAVELARWLRTQLRGLRVIDVRSETEYRAFHIPGAEHIPLAQLTQARFASDDTIVLYSEVGVHGAQAWVFLRALGHRRVYFLRDGIYEWLDDVMSPTLPADASPAARAKFAEIAELSRAFGGTPRELAAEQASVAGAATPARRRGC